MKKKSFPLKKDLGKKSLQSNPDRIVCEDRINAARFFLDTTREQFATNVARAKNQSSIFEAGVLAGPVSRKR